MKIKINIQNIKRIERELNELEKHKLRIGFPQEVAKYATYNEFGTVNIPARPFFREALIFDEGKEKVLNFATNEIKEILTGERAENVLNKIGLFCKGRVVLSIRRGNWTPNASRTSILKGMNKPVLVDTGKMIDSVMFEVIKK